jgi:Dolichyl-phosphate-mannose-protein mannosyltransferase
LTTTGEAQAEEVLEVRLRRPASLRVATALAIASCFVLFGFISLPRYGITIDSSALFYAGDRTLFWLEHPGAAHALDLKGDEPANFHSHFDRFPDWADPLHYPVLPGFVAALTSQVAHDRLGFGDVVDGHQLGLVLLHGLALFLYCLYATEALGLGGGVAATLALALFPCYLGHAFNNAKDLPCADFYALAVLAAGVGWLRQRPRALLAAGVFAGLALSCKMNGIFAIVTVALWLPVPLVQALRQRRLVPASLAAAALSIPYISAAVFVLLWPWLWQSGAIQFWSRLDDYVKFMAGFASGGRPGWTSYPFKSLLFTTPPLVLATAAIALLSVGRQGAEERSLTLLLVIWLGLPLLRIAIPHSNFYDANRHFIEYVPALCALSGAGAAHAYRWVRGWALRLGAPVAVFGNASAGVGVLAVIGLGWADARYHPYETTYFNFLAGGLGGAQRNALYALPSPHDGRVNGTEGDYWFNSLRTGLRQALQLVPPGGSLGLCGPIATQARADLAATPPFAFKDDHDGVEAADFVFASPRAVFCDPPTLRRLEAERPVVRRVERGGGLIYEILGPRTKEPNVQLPGKSAPALDPGVAPRPPPSRPPR